MDRNIVRPLEARTTNLGLRRLERCLLAPNRTFANLVRLKKPRYRDDRSISLTDKELTLIRRSRIN